MKTFFDPIKFLIKYLFNSFGFNLQKKNKKNIYTKRLQLMDNYENKKIYLKKLIKKYPDDITFQLMLFECSLELNDEDYFKNLQTYSQKKSIWEKENFLKNLNIEFIPQLIFMGALGNTLQLRTLIEANQLELRKKRKLFLLWNKKYRINNSILFEYFKEFFTLLDDGETEDDFDTLSTKLEAPLRICLNFNKTALSIPHSSNYVETQKLKQNIKEQSFFTLKTEHREKGQKKLKEMGVPEYSWYVTLHVREPEPNYRGETIKNTTENFRNANPLNYIEAIKKIISQGGYVFRMGSRGVTKMPKIEGLIDYANSDFKSDLMDVFLGATSKFCIANSSGYHSIPSFFSVPRLLTDVPNHQVYFFLNQKDIYLPRLFLNIKTKQKIKFKELFSYPLNALGSDEKFKRHKILPLHNSIEDINAAVSEMLNKVVHKKDINKQTNFQSHIKQIIKECCLKQAGVELEALADVSPNFLNNNQDLF